MQLSSLHQLQHNVHSALGVYELEQLDHIGVIQQLQNRHFLLNGFFIRMIQMSFVNLFNCYLATCFYIGCFVNNRKFSLS